MKAFIRPLVVLAYVGLAGQAFAVDSGVLSGKWVSSDSSNQKIRFEISGDRVKTLELNGKSVSGAELNTCDSPNGRGHFVSISWVEKGGESTKDCYLHCALGANSKGETRLRGFLAVCQGDENQANKCKDYEVEIKRGN